MNRKVKELKSRLKEVRNWLVASDKRENDAHREKSRLFTLCREQALVIKQLEERLQFRKDC